MTKNPEIFEKIHFERSVYEQFLEYTRRFSKNEWGGLLIGIQNDGELYCVAAVIPPQKNQSRVFCEFNRELFPVIYNCFEKIEEQFGSKELEIIAWIHTHPDLGVFFSGTDQDTINYLVKLNPALFAMVVDPVQREFLAVNSKPGNLYGFSKMEVDLDYLQNFENLDQSLFNQLKIIKENINSKINRKIFRLDDSESIHIFIPIQLELLTDRIITSRLKGLFEQTQILRNSLFQQQPFTTNSNASQSHENIRESSDKKNRAIQKLEYYIRNFQTIENELDEWPHYSMDREIFSVNFLTLYDPESVDHLIMFLHRASAHYMAEPVSQFKITDRYFCYGHPGFSEIVKWKKIREMEIIKNLDYSPMILTLIKYKTGLFSGRKTLVLLFPRESWLEKVLEIFKSKTRVFVKGEVARVLRSYKRKAREREMEEKKEGPEEKEDVAQERKQDSNTDQLENYT